MQRFTNEIIQSHILIKPTPEATYKNLVAVLDEMAICSISKYMVTEVSEPEKKISL